MKSKSNRWLSRKLITVIGIALLNACAMTVNSVQLTAHLVPDTPTGQVAARSCNSKFPDENDGELVTSAEPYFQAAVACLRTIPHAKEVVISAQPQPWSNRHNYYSALIPTMQAYGCRNVRRWTNVYNEGLVDLGSKLYIVDHYLLMCDPARLQP